MEWGLVGVGAMVAICVAIAVLCVLGEYREGRAARERRKVWLLPRV